MLLLRVKRGLLCLHPLYQFFDPIKCELVGHDRRQAFITPNLLVEFDALLAHGLFRPLKGDPTQRIEICSIGYVGGCRPGDDSQRLIREAVSS